MIEFEIDGKTIEAEPGSMVIEAADKVGIYIPRFCYHKKLSVAANCRMCLVEVEKAPKPLPACATPVTAGMKVFTRSDKAKDAQRSVMEFLLINHPLDCPICDQGGECELQDLSLGYGKDISRFTEGKRSVDDDNLGSLIATDMTRCIHCTRCVRFGQEVAGVKELGATGRGEHTKITTYIKHSLTSELSGNIIDLCPVGALTSKPYRYTARAWELQQAPSIAPHDCIGSNIYIHTRRQKVMRVVPRENEALNETWLSDRDRFSYLGLNSADRLLKPMVKINGEWQETDWPMALEKVASGIKTILEKYGPQQLAGLISPNATTEECYLLQKIIRGLGSQNIEHRLQQTDFSDDFTAPLYPKLDINLADVETQDVILLIGSNIQREQPLASHRVRKASLRGAQIMSVNSVDYDFNFAQQAKIIVSPRQIVTTLLGIAKALTVNNNARLPSVPAQLLQNITPSAAEVTIANYLQHNTENKLILLGAIALNHPQAASIRGLTKLICELSHAKIGYLTTGANSAGAWLAGAVSNRAAAGQVINDTEKNNAQNLLNESKKAYLLFGIEPELDCANPYQVKEALHKADFVVAFSPFKSSYYLQYADIILPMAAFAETSGTFVNVEGRWQTFAAAAPALGDARPGWKILRVLGNLFDLCGFDYDSSEQIRDELKELVEQTPFQPLTLEFTLPNALIPANITRITEWSLNAVDSLVRRSNALLASASNEKIAVYLNTQLAQRLQLQQDELVAVKQGEGKAQLPVTIDDRIANDCVWIPAGWELTSALGAAFGEVEIHKL